jgi:hypothetical protein
MTLPEDRSQEITVKDLLEAIIVVRRERGALVVEEELSGKACRDRSEGSRGLFEVVEIAEVGIRATVGEPEGALPDTEVVLDEAKHTPEIDAVVPDESGWCVGGNEK